MTSYIRQLSDRAKATEACEKAKIAEKEQAAIKAVRERLTPLDERLFRLLATIPQSIQEEGLSISALQAQFRARGRGHSVCHIGELGAALRRLGWHRIRRWDSSSDGFRALWLPPSG